MQALQLRDVARSPVTLLLYVLALLLAAMALPACASGESGRAETPQDVNPRLVVNLSVDGEGHTVHIDGNVLPGSASSVPTAGAVSAEQTTDTKAEVPASLLAAPK